jgi:hypothetical protein
MNDIIQLKITLDETKPAIWRRVQVEKQTTFFELHHIIQIAFGWKNYHLYEFTVDGHKLGAPEDYMTNVPLLEEGVIDAREITLDSLVVQLSESFKYQYDFGDNWKHEIVVEKFLPKSNRIRYPKCTAGKLNCPPEDCGGIPGFYNLLNIISNRKHPEHRETFIWLGGKYKPELFEKELVNKELASLDECINNWLNG